MTGPGGKSSLGGDTEPAYLEGVSTWGLWGPVDVAEATTHWCPCRSREHRASVGPVSLHSALNLEEFCVWFNAL